MEVKKPYEQAKTQLLLVSRESVITTSITKNGIDGTGDLINSEWSTEN